MHRWFRFCAVIALMGFWGGTLAQSAPSDEEVPVPKHRLKASPTDILQHSIDEQGKKADALAAQLTAQIDAQSKQIEAQGKQLEDLAQRAELQTKQIETLNAGLNRLTEVLLSRGMAEPASPSSSPAAVHPAAPAVSAEPSVTAPDGAAPPTVKPAEPAAPETFAPDGTPTHLVKRGETLTTIARQHGTTVSELLRINKIEDERKLQIGQTLLLPKPAAPAASPKTDTP